MRILYPLRSAVIAPEMTVDLKWRIVAWYLEDGLTILGLRRLLGSLTALLSIGHVLYDFIQFVGHVSRWVSDVPKKWVCHVSRRLPDERVENVTENRQKCQKKITLSYMT